MITTQIGHRDTEDDKDLNPICIHQEGQVARLRKERAHFSILLSLMDVLDLSRVYGTML